MFPSSSSSSFPRLRLNVLQKSLNSWKFSDFSSSVPYSWPDTKREWQCLHVTMMRWNASWKDHHQKSPRRSAHAQQTDIQNWRSLLQFYSQLSCDLENGSSLKLIWKCKAQWKPSSCKVPNISLQRWQRRITILFGIFHGQLYTGNAFIISIKKYRANSVYIHTEHFINYLIHPCKNHNNLINLIR